MTRNSKSVLEKGEKVGITVYMCIIYVYNVTYMLLVSLDFLVSGLLPIPPKHPFFDPFFIFVHAKPEKQKLWPKIL